MSRARVDLGGGSSRSSGSSGGGGGGDSKKMVKVGGAIALFLVAGAVIAWQAGLFEGGGPTNDGVFKGPTEQPQATNPAPEQPVATTDDGNHGNSYGDDSAAAAAPPKRPERKGGGYVNPDAPKDPE